MGKDASSIRQGPPQPRKKPNVAERSEKEALVNLRTKLSLLRDLAKLAQLRPEDERSTSTTLGRLMQEKRFPKSVRQFNLWSCEDLPADLRANLPHFVRNANQTLNRYPELAISVREAVELFRTPLRSRSSSLDDRLAVVRRRAQFSDQIRRIAERELASALLSLRESTAQVVETSLQLQNLEREVATAIHAKDSEIAELRQRNAELTKMLRDIVPIRRKT